MDREQLRELTNKELDLVAGGILALLTGNGDVNFNANSPNTAAADNGLDKQIGENGARVVIAKPPKP